jgi:hypothetical protein
MDDSGIADDLFVGRQSAESSSPSSSSIPLLATDSTRQVRDELSAHYRAVRLTTRRRTGVDRNKLTCGKNVIFHSAFC